MGKRDSATRRAQKTQRRNRRKARNNETGSRANNPVIDSNTWTAHQALGQMSQYLAAPTPPPELAGPSSAGVIPYDASGYRLIESPQEAPWDAYWESKGEDTKPACGLILSTQEFLDLQWVDEFIRMEDNGELFRDTIIERYGDAIPLDMAVVESQILQFTGFETANAGDDLINEEHVCGFAGTTDLSEALHRLYKDGLIVPLSNGLIIAPRLALERIVDGAVEW